MPVSPKAPDQSPLGSSRRERSATMQSPQPAGRCRRLSGLFMTASIIALFSAMAAASSASAESPWWHLTALSRPTYLQPGQAKNEVQEVRLSSEEGFYTLARVSHGKRSSALLSASETAGEVQHQLEGEVYGAGNVKVSSAAGPPGGRAYRITFVGELEDQSVALVKGAKVESVEVS